MRLTDITYDHGQPVDGYGPGFFRVGGEVYQGAILVLPGGNFPWQGFEETDALVAISEQVDVVFVGTGAEISHIPVPFRTALETAGIGVEVMASPAACRTYNILLSEGRRVALALLPV
ncbi:MAG: Mth938-like domain-containing protein [Marinosulfonomonas sp.]|nr:Mth938-like domain-containing protein [Marinosulfonomonas sp.]